MSFFIDYFLEVRSKTTDFRLILYILTKIAKTYLSFLKFITILRRILFCFLKFISAIRMTTSSGRTDGYSLKSVVLYLKSKL